MTRTTSLPSGARLTVDVSGTADDEASTERAIVAAMRELEAFSQRTEEARTQSSSERARR
jgi:hypothetical protein